MSKVFSLRVQTVGASLHFKRRFNITSATIGYYHRHWRKQVFTQVIYGQLSCLRVKARIRQRRRSIKSDREEMVDGDMTKIEKMRNRPNGSGIEVFSTLCRGRTRPK